MSKHELASRYIGTVGGPMWAVLHPLMTVLVYWLVFSLGFKTVGPAGMPFVLYFISGFVPWLLFTNTLMGNVSVVTGNPHLVKKTVFPTEVLPIVNLVAETFTHITMLIILLLVVWLYGYQISPFIFQVVYYYFALCFCVLGLSWLLSSLQVFHRDVSHGVSVVLNFWFWLTPIVWTANMVPEKYRWILRLNPLAYLVDGYRKSLLHHQPAWEDIIGGAYYWLVAIFIFVTGAYVFKRLSLEFADVL